MYDSSAAEQFVSENDMKHELLKSMTPYEFFEIIDTIATYQKQGEFDDSEAICSLKVVNQIALEEDFDLTDPQKAALFETMMPFLKRVAHYVEK